MAMPLLWWGRPAMHTTSLLIHWHQGSRPSLVACYLHQTSLLSQRRSISHGVKEVVTTSLQPGRGSLAGSHDLRVSLLILSCVKARLTAASPWRLRPGTSCQETAKYCCTSYSRAVASQTSVSTHFTANVIV